MATKIIHKKSSVASSVPAAGDLEPGELAINLADQKLYSKTTGGTVIPLGGITEAEADVKYLLDSELTSEASVKALNQGVATTDSPTFAGGTFNGDVGVTGTVTASRLAVSASAATLDLKSTSNIYSRINFGDAADGDIGQIYYDHPNNAMKFITNNVEQMAISNSGNVTVNGTVDGRDVAADGTKLDGIEDGADVTDAANVEPLVDAHLNYSTATSGQVLSYNGADYDWIDVGGTGTVTSVAATVPTGFTVSGSPITTSGTLAISYDTGYQGYTTTEASKLFGIENGADVTDAGNVNPLVDSHLNTGTATTGEVLSWTGSDYDWIDVVTQAEFNPYITQSALSGTTPSVDVSTNDTYTLTTSGNTTFTFTGAPSSGQVGTFSLIITAGGTHTLTWPASVDWAGGTAPNAPASGEKDIYTFMTVDGGTTWYGFLAGDAMA